MTKKILDFSVHKRKCPKKFFFYSPTIADDKKIYLDAIIFFLRHGRGNKGLKPLVSTDNGKKEIPNQVRNDKKKDTHGNDTGI